MITQPHMIGGAIVRRMFNRGAETLRVGRELTREEVLAFPPLNRQALIDTGKMEIFPRSAETGELHIVNRGFGKFAVIRGTVLGDELTKADAEAMVARLQPGGEGEPEPAPQPPIGEPPPAVTN